MDDLTTLRDPACMGFNEWHDHCCTDLGYSHCARPVVSGGCPDVRTADGTMAGGPDEHLVGFLVEHDTVTGTRCRSYASVLSADHPDGRWIGSGELVEGTLTLTPSLLCRLCGDHGFVVSGAWIPC